MMANADGQMQLWIEGWMDTLIEICLDGWKDRRIKGRMTRHLHGGKDEYIETGIS